MPARSDTQSDNQSSLGDSTYEFIDTDTESRDDNATESVASDNGADDVASLADTDQGSSDEEDGIDREHPRPMSPIPTFTGLDGSVHTPTIGQSHVDFLDKLESAHASSIEFEEPFALGAEIISVKHTIRDFSEPQSAAISRTMNLASPATRLVATIRQTMTKRGLSTREPLHFFYVGSHSAKSDIIHKIAAAASVSDESRSPASGRNSQLYNVVPVSAFGSEKTPEVELMHSFGCQIRVDDVIGAVNLKLEGERDMADVIQLSLEDKSYHSVPTRRGSGFTIEEAHDLPHVAIFYCSETDTVEARRTRTFAKTFMSRHSIPVIIISHLQVFEKPYGCMTLDQHALHICLESRDPIGSRNIIHQRLPIDLASFLNVDARQMNRNLAYLTGLQESAKRQQTKKQNYGTTNIPRTRDLEKAENPFTNTVNYVRTRSRAQYVAALVPIGMVLLSFFAQPFVSSMFRSGNAPSVRINGHIASTVPTAITSSIVSAVSSVSTTNVVVSTSVQTATKTITVTHSHSSGPNSLSVIHQIDFDKIPVKPAKKPTNKESISDERTICSAEKLGDREILIRVPSSTLTSWLGREAMSLNVSRGKEVIETERAYSTIDGIILRFSKKEAYGIMNISIVTSKKPKINETFEVNFGSSWLHELRGNLARIFSNLGQQVETLDTISQAIPNDLLSLARKGFNNTCYFAKTTRSNFECVQRRAVQTRQFLKAIRKNVLENIATRKAAWGPKLIEMKEKLEVERHAALQSLTVPEKVQGAVLKAQVESKLWWLKVTGRSEQYENYKKAAKAAWTVKSLRGGAVKRTENETKRKQARADRR